MASDNYKHVFGDRKPVIAMVHLGALPGSPLYDAEAGLDGLVEGARKDLKALQAAGFDAVMFGNENDRPYEFKVDTASTATMAYVIGRLASRDQRAVRRQSCCGTRWRRIALAAATGAAFVREIFTGTYASDMGPWTPDAGRGDALSRPARPARPRAPRSTSRPSSPIRSTGAACADRARSAVFSSIPDAILVSGAITGEAAAHVGPRGGEGGAARNAGPRQYRRQACDRRATCSPIADGCIVGSSLKVDGDTWNAVDPERAAEFMRLVRAARKG